MTPIHTAALRPAAQSLIRLILLALWLELSLIGATFNGVLLPDFQPLTLALLGGGLTVWLVWRGRWGRRWFRTPFDALIVVWWLVFALSLAANGDTWRRTAEALWYMGLYTLAYLALTDLINQGMPRRTLSLIVLIAGSLHVSIGALQTVTLLQTGGFDTLRRPVGLIGNPNAYGALMLVLVLLALSETISARRPWMRRVAAAYTVTSAALLFFSASRGAWIGAAVALMVYTGLVLRHYDLTSWPKLRIAFSRLTRPMQTTFLLLAVLGMLAAAGAGLFLVRSVSNQARSVDLRTYLWDAALKAFAEKPLTGWGLFTYGRQLDRFSSIPPQQPHSHAHNVIFTLAAELGIAGLIILTTSVGVTFWAMRKIYLTPNPALLYGEGHRLVWMGQAAALIGLGVHHLLDTPAMMPVIALLVILLLAGATTPQQASARSQRVQPLMTIAMGMSIAGLIFFGAWALQMHTMYQAALALGLRDARAGAQALESIVAADPRQPAYALELAYLYGLAADEDAAVLPRAITAYQTYLALEPTHSDAWVNLSALYWQAGNQPQAQAVLNEALRLAPAAPFDVLQSLYAGNTLDASSRPNLLSAYAANRARFQFLRDVIEPEYLPQVLRLVGQE